MANDPLLQDTAGARAHPRPGALALLATAQLVLALDYSIVNVALPSIGSALGFSRDAMEWVVSAHALMFGLPPALEAVPRTLSAGAVPSLRRDAVRPGVDMHRGKALSRKNARRCQVSATTRRATLLPEGTGSQAGSQSGA